MVLTMSYRNRDGSDFCGSYKDLINRFFACFSCSLGLWKEMGDSCVAGHDLQLMSVCDRLGTSLLDRMVVESWHN